MAYMATLRFMLDREKKEYKQLQLAVKQKAENIKLLESSVAKESVATYTVNGKYKDNRKKAKKPTTAKT